MVAPPAVACPILGDTNICYDSGYRGLSTMKGACGMTTSTSQSLDGCHRTVPVRAHNFKNFIAQVAALVSQRDADGIRN